MPTRRAAHQPPEFWFDFACPYAYIAYHYLCTQRALPQLQFALKPMLLGGVFRGHGMGDGPLPALSSAKRTHLANDIERWAEMRNVPYAPPQIHPHRTVDALRVAIAALDQDPSRATVLIGNLFRAYWQENRRLDDPQTLPTELARAGYNANETQAIITYAQSDQGKHRLRSNTETAVALGIFGAPTFRYQNPTGMWQLRWGQDQIAAMAADLGLPTTPREPELQPWLDLDFYYDVASPYAYLALHRLDELRLAGFRLHFRPILLGGMFRAIGQADVPLHTYAQVKQAYLRNDLARTAHGLGIPFQFPPHFPIRTVELQRELWATRATPQHAIHAQNVAKSIWGGTQAMPAPQATEAAKAGLRGETSQAVAAGVFGVPTFKLTAPNATMLLWGQDRIPLLTHIARRLAGKRQR